MEKRGGAMKRFLKLNVFAIALMMGGCASLNSLYSSNDESVSQAQITDSGPLPDTGLGAYTLAHALNPSPPDRISGPLGIKVSLRNATTRWALPGPRQMDPAVFGTPANPIGWENTPFPLVGIAPGMRQKLDDAYTIVDQATPFSDWLPVGIGNLEMILTDATAIDGAKSKDKVSFIATFQAPDKSHNYRVEANMALPHGKFFPTFGGVVTDHLLHGATGLGTRLMPTEYAYVAFWAKGKLFVDDKLANDNHIIHMMITEVVRKNDSLQSEGGVNGAGKVLHLMVPPYKIGPNGPEKSLLKTDYLPFPEIDKRMTIAKENIMKMPDSLDKREMMGQLRATNKLMIHNKAQAIKAIREGKMWGQPFLHVMFGNPDIKVTHN